MCTLSINGKNKWRGTFYSWQNKRFAEIYAKNLKYQICKIDGIIIYVSSKPFIGNLTAYVYDPGKDMLASQSFIQKLKNLMRKNRILRAFIFSSFDRNYSLPEIKSGGTYIIDLSISEEKLFAAFQSRCRTAIRKGERAELVFSEAKGEIAFDKWWQIYLSTVEHKGIMRQNREYVFELFSKSIGRLFVVSHRAKIIAGAFLLFTDYPVYYLGAMAREYSSISPNNYLHWQIVLHLKKEGYYWYDLGGASSEGSSHGPTYFKESFGGIFVKSRWYILYNRGVVLKSMLLNLYESLDFVINIFCCQFKKTTKYIGIKLGSLKIKIMRTLFIIDSLFYKNKLIILLYHKVLKQKPLGKSITWISVKKFEEQILELKRQGFNFINLNQTLDLLASGKIRGKYVSITFDDGVVDNYLFAFPLIKKYQIPVTIFIPSFYVGKKVGLQVTPEKDNWTIVPYDKADIVEEFANWEQLREMCCSGVHIGNHTYSHCNLRKLGLKEEIEDIVRCNNEINAYLSVKSFFFSYPFGIYNGNISNKLKDMNFRAAFIVGGQILTKLKGQDLFRIPRVGSGEIPLDYFRFLLTRYVAYFSLVKILLKMYANLNMNKRKPII